MKKLRAGIIGCGFIAKGKHLPGLAKMEGVEVVAFCDIIKEKAQASAKEYGPPDALVCMDYRDVLARDDIDVIHVCTPNSTHAEITVAALKSGKHVMCEKPMAKTAAEAKAMLDTSRETGKKLTIGYQNRFREDSLFMKSLCESGDLGEIYFAKAFATRRRGVPTWGVFMDKEKQGGGPLIDLATHALDLTLWMMQNYEPVTVLGSTFDKIAKLGSPANIMGPWDPAKYEVEDSAFGLVKFKNGATVMVEASWALNMIVSNEAMTLLCGTKGGADMFPPSGPIVRTADFQSAESYHVRVNGERNGKLFIQNYSMGAAFIDDEGKPEFVTGGTKEMQTWINSIRGEGELVVKPEQAYVVTRILEAIYMSAASGDAVHLS
ncbi:MAG: oxidoreductase [Chloroflexi bacterium RBG_13_50_21]|nr:MAG: oxidoreductase [Chloroflexi bacterium RBG_13_50_21]